MSSHCCHIQVFAHTLATKNNKFADPMLTLASTRIYVAVYLKVVFVCLKKTGRRTTNMYAAL